MTTAMRFQTLLIAVATLAVFISHEAVLGTAQCKHMDYKWIPEIGRCVKVYKEKMTFSSAAETCTIDNARLLRLHTFEDDLAVSHRFISNEWFWIGLYRPANEAQWVWYTSDTTRHHWGRVTSDSHVFWGPHDPNGIMQTTACTLKKYHWVDTDCSHEHPFICEEPQWNVQVGDIRFAMVATAGARMNFASAARHCRGPQFVAQASHYSLKEIEKLVDEIVEVRGDVVDDNVQLFFMESGFDSKGNLVKSPVIYIIEPGFFEDMRKQNVTKRNAGDSSDQLAYPVCSLTRYCPRGYSWNKVFKRCIALYNQVLSWAEATAQCGDKLVQIHSIHENREAQRLLGNKKTWLGLRLMGSWVWRGQGRFNQRAVGDIYKNWHTNNPKHGQGGCGILDDDKNGLWFNAVCHRHASLTQFICETQPCWRLGYKWSSALKRCYRVYPEKVHFHRALQLCKRDEGRLVRPLSWDEVHFLERMTAQQHHWIGANDIGDEGKYVWATATHYNGVPLASTHFTAWAHYKRGREPSGGRVENCVKAIYGKFWADVSCQDSRVMTVCELERFTGIEDKRSGMHSKQPAAGSR